MKAIIKWSLLSICAVLIAGCGGNGGNPTSRNLPDDGKKLTITTTSLPDARTGRFYSQSLSARGGKTPYSWSIASGDLPPGLAMGNEGAISGIPTSTGSSIVTFKVIDSHNPRKEAQQLLTLTVTGSDTPLTIGTRSLPGATMGMAYNQTLAASGGLPPYTWSVVSGILPAGLLFSSDGVISGTPTIVGSSTVTFKVTDSNTPQGEARQPLTITVTAGGGPLVILTTSLPNGTVGTPYNQTLIASGGSPPYTWSIMSGVLPPGLSLSDAGVISGTPTTAGAYSILFMVTDTNPSQPMVHQQLSITVN